MMNKGFDLTELYISVGYSLLTNQQRHSPSYRILMQVTAISGDKVYYSLDGDWDLTYKYVTNATMHGSL